MRKLDLYIGKTVLSSWLLVTLVIVGLFLFFTFIEEVDDIGNGDYTLWKAVQFTFLQAPRQLYELFPIAVLLGTLLGLGGLANSNELTVMRASGISISRIIGSVFQVGAILMIAVILVGEFFAPHGEQYAQNLRAEARSELLALNSRYGFWTRSGDSFINIRFIQPGGRFTHATYYSLDEERRLTGVMSVDRGEYRDGQWVLKDLRQTGISHSDTQPLQTQTQRLKEIPWQSQLTPDLINILVLRPARLSTPELYRYVNYLKDNGQGAVQYELAFWTRMFYPLTTAVMVMLAAPFVFGSMRNISIGQRVLIGTLLGVGFYIFNQIVNNLGVLYELNPVLTALSPALLFMTIALLMMRYVFR